MAASNDASARLRAKVSKMPQANQSVSPETSQIRKLSETLRAQDENSMSGEKQALSKQAAALARWNQAISNAAKAGQPHKAVEILAEIEKAELQPDTISYNSVIH